MSREKWFISAKKADFEGWAEEFGISPVLARIIRNRDCTSGGEVQRYLYGRLEDCYDPMLLKDMDKAVELLLEEIRLGTKIRVIGDYDVDGICSSYILTRGLSLLGAKVDTAIPHRIFDGYGLNDHLIREAAEDGIGLIVTCDNGIAADPQIRLAGELGMTVLVTDHHEVPYQMVGEKRVEMLPHARAVVDPKRADDSYPFQGICGGMVAYKMMLAVLARIEQGGVPAEIRAGAEELAKASGELLQFAAFATVCDVMELKDENRILVKEGLRRMKNTENLGLRALIQVNGIDPANLSAYHLGFVIGPCLNATGRLDTAKRALELLLSSDPVEAANAAAALKEMNDSRKNLTTRGVEQAKQQILEQGMEQDKVMVIYLSEVHESLAGIIAGRIRELYHHPVFVLTRGEDGVKGSGRSIETYHMYDAMVRVSHLFTKFGGHKMAAGLSMKEENVEELRRQLNASCELTEEDFIPRVHIDMALPFRAATLDFARELSLLEPFGTGNSKPLFAWKNLIFRRAVRFGKEKQYLRFRVTEPGEPERELVYFGNSEQFESFLNEKYGEGSMEKLYVGEGDFEVSVTYQIGINEYRGQQSAQYFLNNFC